MLRSTRSWLAAPLYAALALAANAQSLDEATRDELAALREGDMRKLAIGDAKTPAPTTPFVGPDGKETTLADTNGKIRLVNFWATWCAPCRREKPALDALEAELGGPDFAVIAVATGRNPPADIARFNEEVGVTHLDTYLDPAGALAREFGVPGLPVTIVLNREGEEIGRLVGGADWTSPSARTILERLVALPAG